MTIERKDVEIRNQIHLMDAEGCHDFKPTNNNISLFLENCGYVAKNIDIWFDGVQSNWKWWCNIEVL